MLSLVATGCSKENDLDTTNNNFNTGGGSGGASGGGGTGGADDGGAGAGGGSSGTGGASGTGGTGPDDGGTGGAVGDAADLDGSMEGCPQNAGQMIHVPDGFCIDVTEVTRAQYETWLLAGPYPPMPPECAWKYEGATQDPKLVHEPGAHWPPLNKPNHPVESVDWCDAWAYCTGVGKRLCGAVGTGEAAEFGAYASAATDEWFAACSGGGSHPYPYGDVYEEDVCQDRCAGQECTEPVQTAPGCVVIAPGYGGLADMSGNAEEWENSCAGDAGKGDDCRLRGGSVFQTFATAYACAADHTNNRSARLSFIGVRCCATPAN